MSRWGNAKPRDEAATADIYNAGEAFSMQHNGDTYTIASGHSVVDSHLAERAVKKNASVEYGTCARLADPDPVVEAVAEEPVAAAPAAEGVSTEGNE